MRICPNINAGAGGPAGQMRNGANTPNFQLYQDAARSVPWGSVEQPQFGAPPPIDFLVPSLTTLAAPATPVYARILGSQQLTVNGLYTSVFSGASTRFNYKSYVLVPPSCSSMTDNPTQVSFTVQANVERACNVSTQNIVFPSRTRLDSPVDSSGGITVNCTLNLPYIISLDGGLTSAVSPTERKMMLNGNSIMYGLFQNEARTVPLGSAAAHILAGTGTGASQWMPVFGRVQSQPTPPPGTYIDRVMATITY